MTTTPSSLPSISGNQANVLAARIDGTGSADTLAKAGFPYPQAVELDRQSTAGTGDVAKLVAVGIPGDLATAIKAAIDA